MSEKTLEVLTPIQKQKNLAEINIGETLILSTPQEVDAVIRRTRDLGCDRRRKVGLNLARVHLGQTFSEFLAKLFKPKRFIGKIGTITITKIPLDSKMVKTRGVIDTFNSFSFLSETDLFSTGKGQIGTLVLETTTGFVDNPSGGPDILKHIQITNLEQVSVLDRLIEESKENWEAAQRHALRTRVLAGLPSLGKR